MAPNPKLPEEMLLEIFSRLPPKAVGRCRCLSTLWRSRLSKPQFLKLHFTRIRHQSLFLITPTDDQPVYQDHCYSIHTLPITAEPVLKKQQLDVPKNWVEVAGSVNGMVLVEDTVGHLILVNPVTGEQVDILRPPFFNRRNLAYSRMRKIHGFGYDCSSDDYKIVSLGNAASSYHEEGTLVSVYSVKKGVWVRKDNFPPHIASIFWHRANGTLLNGAIHWLAVDERSSEDSLAIVAFDLGTEEFRQVPAPVHAPRYAYDVEFCNVSVLGGCLCITELMWRDQRGVVDVWIMKEYGLQESWVKFTSCVNKPGERLAKPLCYIGEDEVVLLDQNEMSLLVSNVKDKTKKVLLSDSDLVADGCVFVESFVSPKQLGIGSELA